MINPKVILAILIGVFLFAFGLSFRSCGHKAAVPAPITHETTKYETLPRPPPVIDTFPKTVLKWKHDTAWIAATDSGKANVAIVSACEDYDTTTKAGAYCSIHQCFLLPDSVIKKAAQPPIFTLRLPPPVVKEILDTTFVTKLVNKPIDWKFELLKDGIICAGGVWLGSKL